MSTIIHDAFKRHLDLIRMSEQELLSDVERSARTILDALRGGKRLFICGNGGSAADSQHFAAEFVCKYKEKRTPLPALALTTDTSALTSIGNDFGFEAIFERQIQAHASTGDVLIALTTSGKSKNVLAAIKQAGSQGLKVIVLTGSGGESLRAEADVTVVVPSSETARIQEVHELIYHTWCEFLDTEL